MIYRGIEKYANENYIYPTTCDFGNFYKIKLDNVGFEIGILISQGTLFFCNRVQIQNEKDFIDFNDIINNKKRDNVDTIKKKLKELSNTIISLYKSGVPLEAIVMPIDSTLIDYKKELGYSKTLKK